MNIVEKDKIQNGWLKLKNEHGNSENLLYFFVIW